MWHSACCDPENLSTQPLTALDSDNSIYGRGVILAGLRVRGWFLCERGHGWPFMASRLCGRRAVLGFLWERSIDRDADVDRVPARVQRARSRSMDRSYGRSWILAGSPFGQDFSRSGVDVLSPDNCRGQFPQKPPPCSMRSIAGRAVPGALDLHGPETLPRTVR